MTGTVVHQVSLCPKYTVYTRPGIFRWNSRNLLQNPQTFSTNSPRTDFPLSNQTLHLIFFLKKNYAFGLRKMVFFRWKNTTNHCCISYKHPHHKLFIKIKFEERFLESSLLQICGDLLETLRKFPESENIWKSWFWGISLEVLRIIKSYGPYKNTHKVTVYTLIFMY